MKLKSIRSRILVGVGVLQLILALASSLFVIRYAQRESLDALDADLASRATSLLALIQIPEEQGRALILRRELLVLPSLDHFRITDTQGHVVADTPDWKLPDRLPSGTRVGFDLQMNSASYHAILIRNAPITDSEEGEHSSPQKVVLVYAAPTTTMDAHVRNVATSTALAGFAMLAVSLLLTFLIVRIGLRPLDALAAQASLVDVGKSNWQPPPGALEVSELRPLSTALSHSINRLKAAFERERQMFSDAAHELRTAVAIVKSTLQVALQAKRPAEDYCERLGRALGDTDRLGTLVGRMLQLAAIEDPETVRDAQTDVAAAIANVLDQLSTLAQARGVEVRLTQLESHAVAVPEQEYALIVTNLLENAIQHSESGSHINVVVTNQNGTSSLTIRDHGSGIPEDALPHIFERFFRTDQSRSRLTGGFGLGLAIVHAITVRYHGTVGVESALGQGTTFAVCLPVCSHVRKQSVQRITTSAPVCSG